MEAPQCIDVTKEDIAMKIIPLQKATSIADVVTQVYGLKPTDPLAAAATQALTNANPQLAGDVSKLPPNTPVVVPTVPGATATSANAIDLTGAAFGSLSAKLQQSIQQASTAAPAAPGTSATPQNSAALKQIQDGVAVVLKTSTD
jgi:hypothetical protein